MSVAPGSTFFAGKRVLVTGHSGFKGSWLTLWLARSGARVTGVSLPPATTPHLFGLAEVEGRCDSHFLDVREAPALREVVRAADPEVVFHLAAQPLVRASYREPLDTFATNVMGTAHLLDALREAPSVRVAVMVTTDKVYRNREWAYPYREEDELGGHDPYSASKAASELVIASYREAFLRERGIAVASARAGNVIGGGDWSEDRLLPDALRAWEAGLPLVVRRPEATRPWQHVLEPLHGYLTLASHLWEAPEAAGAYNFGPPPAEVASVREVITLAQAAHEGAQVVWEEAPSGPHEAGRLALETARAAQVLGVRPRWGLREAVTRTVAWHRALAGGASAGALCEAEIEAYEGLG